MIASGAAHGDISVGVALAGVAGLLSYLISRTAVDEYSRKRQVKTKALVEALGAQARELAKPRK
jgi:hypothetical protein